MKLNRIWVVVLLIAIVMCSPAWADFYFGELTNLGEAVNSGYRTLPDCISYDGDELFFSSSLGGGMGVAVSTRPEADSPWGVPQNLGNHVNTGFIDATSCISADGTELYFTKWGDGFSRATIVVTKRASKEDPWGPVESLGSVINRGDYQDSAWITPDGLSLYFTSDFPGGFGGWDVYVSHRSSVDSPWGTPENLGTPVNSRYDETLLSVASDGSAVFFSGFDEVNERPADYGRVDMFVSFCAVDGSWQDPINLGPVVNTRGFEAGPRISPDGRTLYFASSGHTPFFGGPFDAYQVKIIPHIDFDGNGFVGLQDLLKLVDHVGQDNSLFDIGPMPWGNGLIDRKDVAVLMESWGQEVSDPFIIAAWKLDESDVPLMSDATGSYLGILEGDPVWLPSGGKIDGAISLDGIDDYIKTTLEVRDDNLDAFSCVAWVKGGGAGQVIISQDNGANWLMVDEDGNLESELLVGGRQNATLIAEAVITDGRWHRVGVVWTGSIGQLYVDGELLVTSLASGLDLADRTPQGSFVLIGRGPEGTNWAGEIDDVRFFERIIHP
jgi:hypothetical protein